MSENFNFLWIDDDSSMEQAADNLATETGAQVHFHDLSGQDLAEKVGHLLQESPFDLLIVDHRLDRAVGNLRTQFKATGATAAEMIKDFNPSVPVVCVTKVVDRNITLTQKSAYDAILNATDLTRQSQIILPIAKGFRAIKEHPPESDEALLKLLNYPQADRARLIQILPDNIRTMYDREGFSSLLLRWVMDVFFARPGFLYDSLWAATLIGAKESFFDQVKEKLKPAKYTGIFANDAAPRWWVSRILDMLFKTDLAEKEQNPRVLGRSYLKIPKEGYSKCEISGDDLPDTVAYTDTTNQKRMQVSLQRTQAHPDFEKRLFFEDIRIIKGE